MGRSVAGDEVEPSMKVVGRRRWGWPSSRPASARVTNDILIDADPENQERGKRALLELPDGAVRDMAADDLEKYVVVRVADGIVVDLMKSACGITYDEASRMVDVVEIEGVAIPCSGRQIEVALRQQAPARR